jgi:hypothetical protein
MKTAFSRNKDEENYRTWESSQIFPKGALYICK